MTPSEVTWEHARLQSMVTAAAKSLRWAELFPAADWPIERERQVFRSKVDALIKFEGDHALESKQS